MTIVELCVHMDCPGCESKIKKALHKVKGVDEVEVDMAMQKVTVTGWAEQKKVLKAARKTGRRAVLWPSGGYGGAAEPRWGEARALHHYHQHHPGAAAHQAFFHPAIGPAPSSSYNYYKHGYDEFNAGGGYHQYQRAAHYSASGGGGAAASMFSDENPHACSIM